MLKTSFVIPTKNSADTIEECLASLMPYREQGFIEDIVVVDGESTDGTVEIVKRFPVKLLFEKRKYTPFLELGWRNAGGDLVIIFDSDAYLGEGFFPQLLDLFADPEVGVAGCQVRMVVAKNRTSQLVAQWEQFVQEMHFRPRGIQKLARWVSVRSEAVSPPTGPCHILRRSCLEAVGGYRGLGWNVAVDVSLSRRIMDRGWKAKWWYDAPVYHYTHATLSSLLRVYGRYGTTVASLHREKEFGARFVDKAIYVAGHLATPLGGLLMALRWRQPLHLFVYPLAHYNLTRKYVGTLLSKPDPEKRLP